MHTLISTAKKYGERNAKIEAPGTPKQNVEIEAPGTPKQGASNGPQGASNGPQGASNGPHNYGFDTWKFVMADSKYPKISETSGKRRILINGKSKSGKTYLLKQYIDHGLLDYDICVIYCAEETMNDEIYVKLKESDPRVRMYPLTEVQPIDRYLPDKHYLVVFDDFISYKDKEFRRKLVSYAQSASKRMIDCVFLTQVLKIEIPIVIRNSCDTYITFSCSEREMELYFRDFVGMKIPTSDINKINLIFSNFRYSALFYDKWTNAKEGKLKFIFPDSNHYSFIPKRTADLHQLEDIFVSDTATAMKSARGTAAKSPATGVAAGAENGEIDLNSKFLKTRADWKFIREHVTNNRNLRDSEYKKIIKGTKLTYQDAITQINEHEYKVPKSKIHTRQNAILKSAGIYIGEDGNKYLL